MYERQGIKFVSIWDFIDEEGKPGINADHPKLPASEGFYTLAEQVSIYMKNGEVYAAAPGICFDVFHPEKISTSIVKYTDGIWAWSAEDEYYVKTYGISPGEEFMDYLQSISFLQRIPTEEELRNVNNAFFNKMEDGGRELKDKEKFEPNSPFG